MSIRTKIYDHGRIVEEQMIRFLIKVDERLSALEESESGSSGSGKIISQLQTDMTSVKGQIGSESTNGSILARIKALEDAQ